MSGLVKPEKSQCVTFIELPALFNNDDIMDANLQLEKKMFDNALMYFEWNEWETTKTSEEFHALLTFVKLLNAAHGDIFQEQLKFLVTLDGNNPASKPEILSELKAHFPNIKVQI